jgi:hypothetical protein
VYRSLFSLQHELCGESRNKIPGSLAYDFGGGSVAVWILNVFPQPCVEDLVTSPWSYWKVGELSEGWTTGSKLGHWG